MVWTQVTRRVVWHPRKSSGKGNSGSSLCRRETRQSLGKITPTSTNSYGPKRNQSVPFRTPKNYTEGLISRLNAYDFTTDFCHHSDLNTKELSLETYKNLERAKQSGCLKFLVKQSLSIQKVLLCTMHFSTAPQLVHQLPALWPFLPWRLTVLQKKKTANRLYMSQQSWIKNTISGWTCYSTVPLGINMSVTCCHV